MTAQSPEELELLLEDALMLQDDAAVAALFEEGGVLVERSGCVRGRNQVAYLLAQQHYLAAPCSVTVVNNVAIVVDAHDGAGCFTWRLVGPDGATLREGIDFVAADADGLLGEVRGFFGAYRAPAGESADHSSGLLSPS